MAHTLILALHLRSPFKVLLLVADAGAIALAELGKLRDALVIFDAFLKVIF